MGWATSLAEEIDREAARSRSGVALKELGRELSASVTGVVSTGRGPCGRGRAGWEKRKSKDG